VLNPFTDQPEIILLEGDPKDKSNESNHVKIYTDKELAFFMRMNRRLLEIGHVIRDDKFITEEKDEEKKPLEQYTDDELAELISKPYVVAKKAVDSTDNPVVLNRMLDIAKDLNKSAKLVSYISDRIALVSGRPAEE